MGTFYNGYSWQQRARMLLTYHRKTGSRDPFPGAPCAICGDPERAVNEWHSEDYSEPFLFIPPASYPVCKPCHARLHKRFNASPEEWELFCLHLDAGGYGAEFVKRHTLAERRALVRRLSCGETILLAPIRPRKTGPAWWRTLTLEREALEAPWARPRPLRARPDTAMYRSALNMAGLSRNEGQLIRQHADAPRRTVTMRDLALGVFGIDTPSTAERAYSHLAQRLCDQLGWRPDQRPDGSPVWMSVVAEGWQPPLYDDHQRPYEWVMVASLADAL